MIIIQRKYPFFPILLFGILFLTQCEKEDFEGLPVDGDGNVYDTVVIGTQVWMAENLKTTKYNDGSEITHLDDAEKWSALSVGGYCWYGNNPANKNVYGALYNAKAARVETLCPKGWHLSTTDEWKILIDYLGGEEEAMNKLKETGSIHWSGPNEKATNETGFTARAAGLRYFDGRFGYVRHFAHWWTISPSDNNSLNRISIIYDSMGINENNLNEINTGYSVRCVKDD